jgi:hypothetical protein
VAAAAVASCRSRRAGAGFLAGWDVVNALVPESLLALGQKLVGDGRALTDVDPAARASYVRRVARQAGVDLQPPRDGGHNRGTTLPRGDRSE